jgi:glycosyltransferase involved in cell wall biosynthesis
MSVPSLVSIIVPCYNQAQYLPDALNSILAQTFTNWECIIVNDGSLDNTEEVALKWIAKDERFIYLKKENGGAGSARNMGLNNSKGYFIQFLDADDYIDPEKLEIQTNAIANTQIYALSICDYLTSVETDLLKPHPYYVTPKFRSTNYLSELISNWGTELSIPIHCFLFKRSLFENENIYFLETLPNNEDWECWMNIFKLKPEIKYIDLKLATYRIQNKGTTSNRKLMKAGWLHTVSIQKNKFSKNSEEYKLLEKKYNHIKFRINSGNIIMVYLGIPYYLIRHIVGRTFRFLTGIFKSD